MKSIEEQFANLNVAKRSGPTKDSTYLLSIDVSKGENRQLVAISCSNKSIRIYNRETLAFLREYDAHPNLLNGVRFAHTCENVLFSACSDGTVKCWDARCSSSNAVRVFSGFPLNVFISFDVNCNDTIICAGTEKYEDDVFMVFWDARSNTQNMSATEQPLGVYSDCHNDDITQIRFHPTNPNLVVSGSTDGLVNVFDINKDCEDDALVSTCNSNSSVSFINWAGKDYKQIYCLTHDEGFCWWDLAQLDTEEPITLLNVQDVRETFSTESEKVNYLVGGLYHEMMDKLFVIGGTHMGDIQVMNCDINGLSHLSMLHGGHAATVRSFYWNLEDEHLLTGGEDAQLLLWKPGAEEISLPKKKSLKIASSVQLKVRVHNKSKARKNKN
uniref:WD repeat-containing protein 89 n=1 Tax=Geotrypetes seraphini TaxID=260995 RepID=A0A6P8RN87_GEOSA|nr:WD repeat-containing protein 89-like isoform X3 [Geotrypetes seraphini]XP_033806809.1 WD repeat-containing protein 89-like isoform X3 [Geotrypetes seraphini]XP_033806810.1 WD repeat-containing protein 89-like isoform X3 [Geotrypetes seraphini]XP_033806811.1 WD repeat-containing protein 89-like isoform X3 [Geotrypetes seraphini]XP_033806812.1 WD repeat-containing protein 89-like isoform X3 [Geotrypetes seraphini]